jgi:hypothetical protein
MSFRVPLGARFALPYAQASRRLSLSIEWHSCTSARAAAGGAARRSRCSMQRTVARLEVLDGAYGGDIRETGGRREVNGEWQEPAGCPPPQCVVCDAGGVPLEPPGAPPVPRITARCHERYAPLRPRIRVGARAVRAAAAMGTVRISRFLHRRAGPTRQASATASRSDRAGRDCPGTGGPAGPSSPGRLP